MEARETKLTIILGYNGTGKSTAVKQIVAGHNISPTGKALIITPDPVEWLDVEETKLTEKSDLEFTGVRKYVWNEDEKVSVKAMLRIKKYYKDGLLVFDDCRSYLDVRTPPWLKYFYIRRRQKMIDVIMVGHGFTEVPPRAFTSCSDLILFYTKDNILLRKKDLVNFEELLSHQSRVNKKVLDTSKAWTKSRKIEDNKHYSELIKF